MNVNDLSLAKMAEFYNAWADKPIKKFADRSKGAARLTALMDEKGLTLTEDGLVNMKALEDGEEPTGNNDYFKWRRSVLTSFGIKGNAQTYELMLMDMPATQRKALGLSAHSPERVKEAQEVCRSMTEEFVKWAVKEFDLKEDFGIRTRFDWRIKRTRSRGGKYAGRWRSYESGDLGRYVTGGAIYLAMSRHTPILDPAEGTKFDFHEYKSFCQDGEIGTWETNDWKEALRILTIHECAHAVQMACGYAFSEEQYAGKARKAHGELWKDIYRAARQHFKYTKPVPVAAEAEEQVDAA